MRDILFRGKTILDNEWVMGAGVYKSEGKTWIITDDVTKTENRGTGSDAINPETVGQYTGLTDKNGTKIFEGDIIEFNNDPNKTKWSVVFGMNYGYGINSPGFILKDFRNATSPFNEKMVIIGNIHDNPEFFRTPQNDEVRE
jgi:hypothetical protein